MSDATLDQARQSIAVGSKSFAMASRFLPAGMHEDCVMLYAWCRHADDVIDGQEAGFATATPHDPAARLAELRDLNHRHVDELLDGFGMDVEGRVYHDMNDLLDYCYHVAGAVGVMMARIMGVRDDGVLDRASDLGPSS